MYDIILLGWMVMANYFVNGDGISTPLDIYIYIYTLYL